MKKTLYAVIMAGGSGRRMGSDLPKQFLPLDGKPIICHTIAGFCSAFPDCRIVTVLPGEYIQYWKDWCLENRFHYPQILVEGGITRFHSVKNALAKVPDGAVVAVHDSVRPFVSGGLLAGMYDMMEKGARALIPVVPVVDSLVSLDKDDGTLRENGVTVDRSRTFAVQTPQMFLSEELKDAYRAPYDTSFTDDASVARRHGIPVSYTDGEKFNIKITTPEDLVMGEFICGRISSSRVRQVMNQR